MVQTVQVGNVVHEFPDEATPQMIAKALNVKFSGEKTSEKKPESKDSYLKTIADSIRPLVEHLGTQYQPGVNLATGLMSRGLPGAKQAVQDIPFAARGTPPSATESLMVGTGEQIPEFAASAGLPPARFAKYLPEGANFAKGLLNYGTDVVQNAATVGGMNALEGNSPVAGAVAGGTGTAVLNPLVQGFGSRNPLVRIGAGAGVAGLLATLANADPSKVGVAATAGGLLGLRRGRNAHDLAVMNLLKDVDIRQAAPRLNAARRQGLTYLTPAEAMDSGYIGAIQGHAGSSPEGALFLEKKGKERIASETNAIRNFYKNIFDDPTLSPKVTELYTAVGKNEVSPQFFNTVTKSATVRSAMKEVDTNPVYQDILEGVPRNSFAYLDQVKRALNDMEQSALKLGNNTQANAINGEIHKLLKKMDGINPSYKVARGLAERQIAKREIQSRMAAEELKGTSFYKKNFKNQDKFDDLIFSLRNAPEAQKQAHDLKSIFETLIDRNKTPRAGSRLAETNMLDFRSTWGAVMHKLEGGSYDKAMVELMTNPKWYKEVARAKEMAKPNEKLRYFTNLLSRASGQRVQAIVSKE